MHRMSDVRNDPDVGTEGLIGPAVADVVADVVVDVVVDPAALEHLASDATLTQSAASGADEALVLSLEDLLPDVEGTVVMLTDENLPVNLMTDEPLAGSGVVGEHVSAGGLDVEGLFYYSFANGLTLYSDTDIVIVSETTGA
jgi:hypothetical protein